MSKSWLGTALLLSLLSAALSAVGGCTKEAAKERPKKGETASTKATKADDSETWWCKEHGMPEEICAQCNAKLAGEFKNKGDWCKKHDRPESQCFICRPELKEKFAAQYRARYGKEPPPMDEEKQAPEKETAVKEGKS
jgi:hypothetical protein